MGSGHVAVWQHTNPGRRSERRETAGLAGAVKGHRGKVQAGGRHLRFLLLPAPLSRLLLVEGKCF